MISTATRQLTRLEGRELVRDRRYFWFALLFPFGMLSIFVTIGALVPESSGAPDFVQLVVPMALFLAVTSTALTVTAGPLAGMRDKGTLRLLGTTPVGRSRLVLTHMAVRVVMVVCQIAVLLLIGVALGAVPLGRLPALFAISLLGMAMFLAVGYLIGGRLTSPDAASNLATLVQLGTLFVSGLAFPFVLLPDGVATALRLLPSTFFADLMLTQMPDGDAHHPAWLSVLVVAATAAALMALAIRTFRWDQGEVD